MPPLSSHTSAEDAPEQDLKANVLALTHEVGLERQEAILEGGTMLRFSRRDPGLQIAQEVLTSTTRLHSHRWSILTSKWHDASFSRRGEISAAVAGRCQAEGGELHASEAS
jgi:hypothetical protein